MRIKVSLHGLLFVLTLTLSFMSGYSVFYGSVGSITWYLLYYGKFFLILFCIFECFSHVYIKREDWKDTKKLFLLFCSVPIVIFLYSIIIWTINSPTNDFITRGISDTLFKLLSYAGGIAIAYKAKENATKYVSYAAIITYVISLLMGAVTDKGYFFRYELFNRTTSAQGKYTELHEIAFIIGMCLIFFVFSCEEDYIKSHKWSFIMLIIFFIIADKRIGFAAFGLAGLFGLTIKKKRKLTKESSIFVTGIITVLICLLYTSLSTSNGLISLLESHNIDLMGRDIIYRYFRQFCDFTPTYFGRGVGFVTRQFDYTSSRDLYQMAVIRALHNDYMKVFIEIGFWGFIIWLIYWLIYIPRKINKLAGFNAMFSAFCVILYTFVTYATDNTEGYFNYQLVLALLISSIVFLKNNTGSNERTINDKS